MRNLRFRRAARTSVLGTAALIAALSLTACQSGNPAPAAFDAEAPAPQKPADATSAAPAAPAADTGKNKEAAAGDTGTVDSGSGTAKNSGSAAPKAVAKTVAKPQDTKSDSESRVTCTDTNTKLTMTSVQRPVNHMLLTVTNTGSTDCDAYYYPFLKFSDAQSVPPVIEESQPQAVVTLSPGQSAYAGVLTSSADGSGSNGRTAEDLEVAFQNTDRGQAGNMVSVPLAKDVYVDSKLAVTFWQTEMDDALKY
ncbi:DUF4232 domain-containing protein [Streptomyces sp. NPDC102441]|uniref:DUF4232 domain-containing protein n=1 Tax=Streptomyces sp. NPDC102441 TaxID=3366176 RepID=UPI00381F7A20